MDATAPKPILGRQSSTTMRQIPSFNDFCSLVSEDISAEMAASTPRSVQTPRSNNMMSVSPKPLDRKWSVESDTMSPSTSRSLSSSFGDTFRRALYEHMRGN